MNLSVIDLHPIVSPRQANWPRCGACTYRDHFAVDDAVFFLVNHENPSLAPFPPYHWRRAVITRYLEITRDFRLSRNSQKRLMAAPRRSRRAAPRCVRGQRGTIASLVVLGNEGTRRELNRFASEIVGKFDYSGSPISRNEGLFKSRLLKSFRRRFSPRRAFLSTCNSIQHAGNHVKIGR